MLLTKLPDPNPDNESPPFVATITLHPTEAKCEAVAYPAYTYIDVSQGERVIFPAIEAYPGIPGRTPKGLQKFREAELKELRVMSPIPRLLGSE